MKKNALIVFLLLMNGLVSNVLAVENQLITCMKEKELRAIEIIYPTKNKIPCEVSYTKSKISETLWKAKIEEGYCEAKAKAFIANLERWDWSCKSVIGGPQAKL